MEKTERWLYVVSAAEIGISAERNWSSSKSRGSISRHGDSGDKSKDFAWTLSWAFKNWDGEAALGMVKPSTGVRQEIRFQPRKNGLNQHRSSLEVAIISLLHICQTHC